MEPEDYFPMKEADEKADSWVSSIDRKRKWKGGWGRTALLVLDMQRFFLEPESHAYLPAGKTALNNILKVISEWGGTVIFTRHINDPDEDNLMTVWWRDVIKGEMSQLVEPLKDPYGHMIDKSYYSAFHGTDLEEKLHSEGIDTVIISGVMTDLCCETTARDAFMRGFRVVFLADCTATVDEETHLSTLKTISRAFGEVITSRELLSR
jgi:nicotinamidase-related amidase